jgi:hypothetical protein
VRATAIGRARAARFLVAALLLTSGFVLAGCGGSSGSDAEPTPAAPTPKASRTPTPDTNPAGPASPVSGQVTVRTVEEIRAALAGATPGTVITVADGEYTFRPRLLASAEGTAQAPITVKGTRAAVLRSKDAGGDYGLSVTGDHWRVEGLTVAHASKGIVLDGSVGTVLDGVEVYDIGAEGVHFRACSSQGVLRNSLVHDTGVDKPQFGEGVYVGSANSNWSDYGCHDGKDGTEGVLVEDNVFRDVPAEGADLKEGSDSGTLRRNVFEHVGFSGANSADSAVDAKGNGWVIEGNTVRLAGGAFADAFQSHTVFDGYGTGNVFRANHVEGPVPGFGIGLYPAAGNVVGCDNSAPQAAKGLASIPCTP